MEGGVVVEVLFVHRVRFCCAEARHERCESRASNQRSPFSCSHHLPPQLASTQDFDSKN